MIPFASVACLLGLADGRELEVSLVDLSAIGFTVRLPHAWAGDAEHGLRQVTLRFHRLRDSGECVLPAASLLWTREETCAHHVLFHAETTDPAYRTPAKQFMQDYTRYTGLKEARDDAALSQALTGYPAAGERVFPADFPGQRRRRFAALTPDADWPDACAQVPELAVSLASPQLWEAYLSQPMAAFSRWYWAAHGLSGHPLARRTFNAVYIGNPTCPLLFPDREMLTRLLDKAEAEPVRPILVMAPVSEGRLDAALDLLGHIGRQRSGDRPLEVVVNDWGLAYLLRDRPGLALTMGVLLNKRRKDVRMPYMQGFDGQGSLLAETAVHAPFLREELAQLGFSRVSWEACGYPFTPAPMPAGLHLPFYQMNTAGRCTLRAACETGDRGHQMPDDACPRWCRDHAFLYPEMLGMAGRYNTLYGLDARSLTDGAYLRRLSAGVDRLVIDLL